MSKPAVHDFGLVDSTGDFYELLCPAEKTLPCVLVEILHTERGPRRTELAEIPADLWKPLSDRVVRELAEGMGESERSKKSPILKPGANRLSPLIGRELAVLFWALAEACDEGPVEAILHGWRELAREERWWLYTRGAAPGQKQGMGWRLGLFHALSAASDSRVFHTAATEKKSPGNGLSKIPQGTIEKKTRKNPRKKGASPSPDSPMRSLPATGFKRKATSRTGKKEAPERLEKAPGRRPKAIEALLKGA